MLKKDKPDVSRVAKIARLDLTASEIRRFQKDLDEILRAFKDIDKIKTDKTKPSFQPLDVKDVIRQDKEETCLSRDDALANTKHKEKGFFKGPRAV